MALRDTVQAVLITAAILVVFTAMVVLIANLGCTITLKDQGSFSMDFRQGFTIGSQASETKAESRATADFKPLIEYILALRKPGDETNAAKAVGTNGVNPSASSVAAGRPPPGSGP